MMTTLTKCTISATKLVPWRKIPTIELHQRLTTDIYCCKRGAFFQDIMHFTNKTIKCTKDTPFRSYPNKYVSFVISFEFSWLILQVSLSRCSVGEILFYYPALGKENGNRTERKVVVQISHNLDASLLLSIPNSLYHKKMDFLEVELFRVSWFGFFYLNRIRV